MAATTTSPTTVARAYFDSWRARDFTAFRALLHDDATFRGPLGTADDGDACAKGIEGMTNMLDDVEVVQMTSDGAEVMTWLKLKAKNGATVPVVNWSHVEDGLITRIQVTFDPRPFLGDD